MVPDPGPVSEGMNALMRILLIVGGSGIVLTLIGFIAFRAWGRRQRPK